MVFIFIFSFSGNQTKLPFISFKCFHNGIFFGPQWESWIFSSHNSISLASFLIHPSAVGASVGAVPHSGGWTLLQWARVWTFPRNPQWHPELTGIRWQHSAGFCQMGHAGADAQPLTMFQRGRDHCIKRFLVFKGMLSCLFRPIQKKIFSAWFTEAQAQHGPSNQPNL